ncbi:MAG: hypothetical protein BZ136_04165 [Methanosphaera sp. rholeuAM74]|nr:MAG: hypothetical protein BZ136_04165 [Methanosphaera sp. rholeuAM74]
MKKKLIYSITIVLLLCCISTASAGWLDFLDGDMEEHDFGNFTAKVPKNASFNESVQPNDENSTANIAEKFFGGSVSIDFTDAKWNDEKYKNYLHPCWSTGGEKDFIIIDYIDSNEDNLTSENAVHNLFYDVAPGNDIELDETGEDYSSYYWNSYDQYIVKIDNKDKTAFVVIRSDNPDLLNSIIDSVEFK